MAARIRKGDTVIVISGRDKGKTGTVLRVLSDLGKLLISGINLVVKHQKPTQREPEGKKFQKEALISACKVMPVDPSTGKGVRVRFLVNQEGKKIRVAATKAATQIGEAGAQ